MAKKLSSSQPRAALCARVSTSGQADLGRSLSSQLDLMRTYATEHGWHVTSEIEDTVSGTVPVRERPGGAQLYRLIDTKAIDVVLFYTLDRLTRDEDLIEISVFRRDLRQSNIKLWFCDSGESDLSAMGGVIDTLRAAGAAEERRKINERTARGIKAKVLAGKWSGRTPEPYGYRRAGKRTTVRLVIHKPEAAIVKRIFHMYVVKLMSLRAICDVLNAEGVPSPGRDSKAGGGAGRMWYPITVKEILSRRIYIGQMVELGTTINLPDLAIVDTATFQKAQDQFAKNKALAPRNRQREYLLAGLIKCSCGRSMYGKAHILPLRVTTYYVCSTMRNIAGGTRKSICEERMLRADAVEEQTWAWLVGILSDDAALRMGLQRRRERNAAMLAPKQERLTSLDELIAQGTRQFRRTNEEMNLYTDDDNPAYILLQQESRRLGQQLGAWSRERERLSAEVEARDMTAEEERSFLADIAKLRQGMPEADYETRRYYLQRLDVQAQLMRDADGLRWVEVSCGLTGDIGTIAKGSVTSTLRNTTHRSERIVWFSTRIPIGGQPRTPRAV